MGKKLVTQKDKQNDKLEFIGIIIGILGLIIAIIALFPAFKSEPEPVYIVTITPEIRGEAPINLTEKPISDETHVELTKSAPTETTIDPTKDDLTDESILTIPTPSSKITLLEDNEVYETIWHNNQSWSRKIPIVSVNGMLQQDLSGIWTRQFPSRDFLIEEKIQAVSDYVINNIIFRNIWIDNQEWTMTAPINDDQIRWELSSGWGISLLSPQQLPGTGDIQAVGDLSTGRILHRSIWRGNQGWSTTVSIINGNVNWEEAEWIGPVSLDALPGRGELQATSDAVLINSIRQTYWRDNEEWYRIVPIVNGKIQWGSNYTWYGPIMLEELVGENDLQAFSDTDLR